MNFKIIYMVLTALFFATQLVNAQIHVNEHGNVGLGTDNTTNYQRLRILNDDTQSITGTNYNYGIAVTVMNAQKYNYGIVATSDANGIGLGHNYAIYARAVNGTYNNAGYFYGNVTVTGTFSNPSDLKLKQNIKDVGSVINNIKMLKVKEYKYIKDPKFKLPDGRQYGLIAQDLEAIYPELVTMEGHPVLSDDNSTAPEIISFKAINYIKLVPILARAIQEQQEMIEELQQSIELLKNKSN